MASITEIVANSPFTTQIPQPLADVGSLAYCARAMKSALEILTGARGNAPFDRAVLFSDLAKIGLISGTSLSVSPTLSASPSGTASGDLGGSYPSPVVVRVNGVAYPSSPSTNTIPLVTGANTVTYAATSQLPGTATNDDAAGGNIGEFVSASAPNTTATVTITIASPGVVTWTAHGLGANCPVQFTTTGALPTGLAVSTTYFVVGSSITANTFQLATSIANAIAGTAINTSGSQSGVQTAISAAFLTSATIVPVVGIQLTAGDWEVWATADFYAGASTVVSVIQGAIHTVAGSFPTPPSSAYALLQATLTTGATQRMPVGRTRLKLAGTTVVYLEVAPIFTTSTLSGGGIICARRPR